MRRLIDILFIEDTSKVWLQLFRYAFVGGLAFVADYGSLYLLVHYAGLHHLLAAAIAFLLGLFINWQLSTSWVFAGKGRNDIQGFALFAVIGIIGLALNEGIMYIGTDIAGLHYMISKLLSTLIVFLWNFFARRTFVFRRNG